MRHLADDIIGDSIVAEMTPFYFREEYMESVPFVYVKNLISTTADYLELIARMFTFVYFQLKPAQFFSCQWHNGVIPANELWLKLGG